MSPHKIPPQHKGENANFMKKKSGRQWLDCGTKFHVTNQGFHGNQVKTIIPHEHSVALFSGIPTRNAQNLSNHEETLNRWGQSNVSMIFLETHKNILILIYLEIRRKIMQ